MLKVKRNLDVTIIKHILSLFGQIVSLFGQTNCSGLRTLCPKRLPGNIRFREKARELGSRFISCSSKEGKYKVSEELVEFIKGENRRFLEKDGPEGLWYEVVGNDIRKKASQALRDEGNRVDNYNKGTL